MGRGQNLYLIFGFISYFFIFHYHLNVINYILISFQIPIRSSSSLTHQFHVFSHFLRNSPSNCKTNHGNQSKWTNKTIREIININKTVNTKENVLLLRSVLYSGVEIRSNTPLKNTDFLSPGSYKLPIVFSYTF